jgi:hypothetical protein
MIGIVLPEQKALEKTRQEQGSILPTYESKPKRKAVKKAVHQTVKEGM